MSPRAMPTARAISSIGAFCMPRSSNSARVARTRSRSRSRRARAVWELMAPWYAPARPVRERLVDTCSQRALGSRAVAERGAVPNVSAVRRRTLSAMRSLFTPLLPDDYLELINPLWSTRELRGRIERIKRENGNAVTIVIRRGHRWPGHRPGQYLRVGVVVDGVFHWRAYSLTSSPERDDRCIAITPKLVEAGKVTPYLVNEAKCGAIIRLGGVE